MEPYRDYIEFILDGALQRITWENNSGPAPTTTLLQYLRKNPNHKGTKEGCAEGDCGACTVVIASLNYKNQMEYQAVNSCLIFLPQVHGKQVITVENLEYNQKLHPVQQAMVYLDASQCGFCTPGFVMSMFALYKENKNQSDADIREAFSGNLCRCTGYQSILNAANNALKDKTDDQFSGMHENIKTILENVNKQTAFLETTQQQYFQATTWEDALKLKQKYPQALVISGSSDIALRVTKKGELIPQIIDISSVSASKQIDISEKEITIGSNVSLNRIKEELKELLPAMHKILSVFGSKQIRHVATLGGNIGSASPIGDTLPVLMAYQAQVNLISTQGKRTINLSDFITGYRQTQMTKNELIESVTIPVPENDCMYDVEKISKRTDLDISTVSAALRLKCNPEGIIEQVKLYFGGMAAFTQSAVHTEQFLLGKTWNLQTLKEAGTYIEQDFHPISDARSEAEGRIQFAKNLLLKFHLNNQKSSEL